MSINLKCEADIINGKAIRFCVRAFRGDPPQEGIAEGNGTLHVIGPDGNGAYEAFIDITVPPVTSTLIGEWKITHVPLDQRSADCIQIEADGTLVCVDSRLSVW